METWKAIEGHAGYSVSNYGRVRAEPRLVKRKTGGFMRYKGCIRKPSVNRKGYYAINLSNSSKDGYKTSLLIHRLVAQTFIPNPDNKPQVNHKDGVKTNNHADNLEWCTNDENHEHKLSNKLCPPTHTPKRVAQVTKDGEVVNVFDSIYAAAKSVNSDQYMVSRVVNGLRPYHKGYAWCYVTEGATT